MTLLWSTPKEWHTEDPITKETLNAISSQLTYLYNPSQRLVTIKGTGSNQTTTSTSPADLDAADYGVSVELSGSRDVLIEFMGIYSQSALTNLTRIDFLIDGTTYASSLTGTQLASGVWQAQTVVAAAVMPVMIHYVIPAGTLAAGVHTFKPRWWVSAGTATWYMASGYLSQFRVGEN